LARSQGQSAWAFGSSRYHGLNFNSYFYRRTIEFRYFEGTTHAGKVKAYVPADRAPTDDVS